MQQDIGIDPSGDGTAPVDRAIDVRRLKMLPVLFSTWTTPTTTCCGLARPTWTGSSQRKQDADDAGPPSRNNNLSSSTILCTVNVDRPAGRRLHLHRPALFRQQRSLPFAIRILQSKPLDDAELSVCLFFNDITTKMASFHGFNVSVRAPPPPKRQKTACGKNTA